MQVNPEEQIDGGRSISGRWVVSGMFAFGIAITAALWVYWDLHTAPFRPLTEAIAAAYPQSVPRVEGGRLKGREGSPTILRVVMRVPFDPGAEPERARALAGDVGALAAKYHDLRTYDVLEAHFYWLKPEDEIREQTVVLPMSELLREADGGEAAVSTRPGK